MTEPTGYTALDLVGFTDKGTYNPATPYVKNDLVHYSGDTWRCLIDDTTNITPVEGVNWTLFIEAPTNAIEGIIAPVETNPVTNSYAVGRQFIYDDKLYIVLTAITAGDTLVAYEDDPSNANIQLADPVETQLLNFEEKAYSTDDSAETALASDDHIPFYDTSAAAKKKMTVANMIGQTVSNPNLLDNPWFTVNQRGESSYNAAGYTFDRWRMTGNAVSIEKSNGVITFSTSAAYNNLMQPIELGILEDGKTYTLSILKSDGKVFSKSFVFEESSNYKGIYPTSEGLGFYGTYRTISNYVEFIVFDSPGATARSISFKAVKLEVGFVSTLAMDTAPNYATELAKCQRYFVRYARKSGSGRGFLGMFFQNSSAANLIVELPTSMRATPTVTLSSEIQVETASGDVSVSAIGSVVPNNLNDKIVLTSLTMGSSQTAGTVGIGKIAGSNYIDFSADL